jgi:hypothetical protein
MGSSFGPAILSTGEGPCSGSKKILLSKKILDRILKPDKVNGNVGNYEDDAELISIEHSEEHPAVVVAGDSRGVACSTGNR